MQSPNAKPTCWITGAGGLIGSHIVRLAPHDFHIVPLTREILDLNNFSAVRARLAADRPAVVIHCAGVSKSSECEQNPSLAWRVNSDTTRVLADIAPRLLFLSTDLVFDGIKGNYAELDSPNPLTVYGKTKIAAEKAVLADPRHTVVRTSLNGGASPQGDRSFTEQLINAWKAGRAPKLFADEFRAPIMADVTAQAVWQLIAKNATGLFHVSGAERLSRYEIGEVLAERVPGLHPKIERASWRDYPGPPRSPDTSLDSSKAQALLSFPLPRFSDWIAKHCTVQH